MMMFLFSLLVFASSGDSLRVFKDLPEFTWSSTERSIHDVPLLKITFPDGSLDVALLKPYNPVPPKDEIPGTSIDNCIFEGNLRDEPKVYVTVLHGCPYDSSYTVLIPSQRLRGKFAFQVKDLKVSSADHLFAKAFSRLRDKQNNDVALDPPKLAELNLTATESNFAFPPLGIVMNWRIYYDQLYRLRFGNESLNVARRLVAIAQNIYYWPSLRVPIRINVQSFREIQNNISIDMTGINIMRNLSTDLTTNFNYVFSFHNNAGGTVGLAYVGVSCFPQAQFRVGLGDYFVDDFNSAITLAHEGGHNFGARHDFADPYLYVGRRDSNNRTCKNVGAIMDYYQDDYIIWSNCSAEFLQNYYNALNAAGANCFEANNQTTTTTTTTSTSTSTSTTTSTSTSTSTTTTPRERICRQANTAECNTICRRFNFDDKHFCFVRNTFCNCHFFGTSTTSATSAPTTTMSAMDRKCVNEGRNFCLAECQAQRFSSTFFCRRPIPKLRCRCSLFA